MSPTEFLDDNISVKQNLAHMNGMIATDLVIRHSLVLTGVFILIKAFSKFVPEWVKIVLNVNIWIFGLTRLLGVLNGAVISRILSLVHFLNQVDQIFLIVLVYR